MTRVFVSSRCPGPSQIRDRCTAPLGGMAHLPSSGPTCGYAPFLAPRSDSTTRTGIPPGPGKTIVPAAPATSNLSASAVPAHVVEDTIGKESGVRTHNSDLRPQNSELTTPNYGQDEGLTEDS